MTARLLGRFDLRIDGEAVMLDSPRAESLLAYLLLHRSRFSGGALRPQYHVIAASHPHLAGLQPEQPGQAVP